jgi:hypothetical protein
MDPIYRPLTSDLYQTRPWLDIFHRAKTLAGCGTDSTRPIHCLPILSRSDGVVDGKPRIISAPVDRIAVALEYGYLGGGFWITAFVSFITVAMFDGVKPEATKRRLPNNASSQTPSKVEALFFTGFFLGYNNRENLHQKVSKGTCPTLRGRKLRPRRFP